MNLFGDFYFFGFVLIASIPAVLIGIFEKPKKWYVFAATIFFVWSASTSNIGGLFYMIAFCIYQAALATGLLKLLKKRGRKPRLLHFGVLLSILPLCVYKIFSFYLHMHVLGFLGISYMTFKAAQIIIEIYDGLIEEVSLADILQFFLFFPAILSGPIDRSRRFKEDLEAIPSRASYLEMVGDGLFKIILGILYKFVIASACYQAMTWLGNENTFRSALIYMYAYGFYLFFDFAGYSNMAIGVSYIFGIRTPENFNKPFISKDIKEFWDRWHITLSHWFRDFIFSRFTMSAMRGKWFKSKLTTSTCAFMINMGIMGVWHGFDLQYIMYGLYHGILLSLTEIYQKKFKLHKRHKKEGWYKFASWFITFNLVMFGLFIFSGRFTHMLGIAD